jgi:CHAT domain-containing protein
MSFFSALTTGSIAAFVLQVASGFSQPSIGAELLSRRLEPLSPSLVIAQAKSVKEETSVDAPLFVRNSYNPAILHLRYTESNGKTIDSRADSFIDFTLIPAEGDSIGRRIELSSSTFRNHLRGLYSSLSRRESMNASDVDSPSRQLFKLLIAPILPLLEEQRITTLLISADRGLQAIPFSALSDGQIFFGERFAFSLTPSLSLMEFDAPGELVGNQLLAFGASQFDGLAPLPLVPQELEGINVEGMKEQLINESFTPDAFLEEAADPRYSNVHVATHADFVPGGPALSTLHSGAGPIALDQLEKLRRSRKGIPLDLIVFSACRTALGDRDSELGFAGLALQAGAKSAIGTLWYVDDVVTSAYFVQMYRFLSIGVPKAEAMQLTRQSFIRGLIYLENDRIVGVDGIDLLTGLTPIQVRRVSNGMNHPYFWSGIQLMGTPW